SSVVLSGYGGRSPRASRSLRAPASCALDRLEHPEELLRGPDVVHPKCHGPPMVSPRAPRARAREAMLRTRLAERPSDERLAGGPHEDVEAGLHEHRRALEELQRLL